jgi:hypothetical protein
MSAAPFLRAVQRFRYSRGNAAIPALVACASRQQAYDLWRYLQVHRPPERPEPALILGETPTVEREGALAAFEAGERDTLIQVGVLIEGWSSPRCKLLIDLAPSASRVRATQKTFRVMTRHGDAEARIYVILLVGLPRLPILPMDLLGTVGEYGCGTLVGEPSASRGLRPITPHSRTPIAAVHLKHRIVLTGQLGKPALDAACLADVRAVLATCPTFDAARPVGPRAFRWLWFAHPTFTGRGDFLLAWLGVASTGPAYLGWLARLYPEHLEAFADVLLAGSAEAAPLELLELEQQQAFERLDHLVDRREAQRACAGLVTAIDALGLRPLPTPMDLEAAWSDRDLLDEARALVAGLPARLQDVLGDRLGWGGEEPLTLQDIGALEDCSRSRVAQMIKQAISRLRSQAFKKGLRPSWPDQRQKQAPPTGSPAEASPLPPVPAPWSSASSFPSSCDDPDLRLRLRELAADGF